MNRISMSAATAVLLACSVALGAQTSSGTKPYPPPSTQGSTAQTGSTGRESGTPAPQRRATRSARSSPTANPPQEITLTGCLQASDQSTATASNTTTGASATRRAQANAIPTFILSSASQGSSPSSSEPRSVGTTGNASSSSSSASLSGTGSGSYILQGLDLSRQAGQQVEVTGTMMPAPTVRAGRNRSTSTSAATTEANASMPKIRVTSVRMLSEHCSNQ
jgi:hypothetical protein